jgi:hypothetical protein
MNNLIFNNQELMLILKVVLFLLSTGVVGWFANWLWKKVENWVVSVNSSLERLSNLEKTIETTLRKRLDDGEVKFKLIEEENARTRVKLVEMVSEAAVEMAEARVQFMQDFVSEANLKPKVVEITNGYCRENCRGKK